MKLRRPRSSPALMTIGCWLLVSQPLASAWARDLESGEAPRPAESEHDAESVRRLLHEGRYAEADAVSRDLQARTEQRFGVESLELARALDLRVEAMRLAGRAAEPDALELAESALRIKQAILGPEDPEVGDSLRGMGNLLQAPGRQDYAEARSFLERSLQAYESALGPDAPRVGQVLADLGYALFREHRFEEAAVMLDRAIAILEARFGKEHPEVARALETLANLRSQSGSGDSLPLHRRAVAIRVEQLGEDHPSVAQSYSSLGLDLFHRGRYLEARDVLRRSVEIREEKLGPEHPLTGHSLGNLSLVYARIGDTVRAVEILNRVLSIAVTTSDHRSEAIALGALAQRLHELGEYPQAMDTYERAVARRKEHLGASHPAVALTLSYQAQLHIDMGDPARARILLEEALSILLSHGDEHPYLSDVLTRLGELDRLSGETDQARRRLEQALALDERAVGPEHPIVARDLAQIATLSASSGDLEAARDGFERAATILREHHDEVFALWADLNLAAVLRAQEDREGALTLYRRIAPAQERLQGAHPETVAAFVDLAEMLAEGGADSEALEAALHAEEMSRRHLRLTTRGLAEGQALRLLATMRSGGAPRPVGPPRRTGLDLALSIAAAGRGLDSAVRAFDSLVRTRTLVLDEMASRHRAALEARDPESRRLVDELARARSWLANLVVGRAGELEPAAYAELIEAARSERDRAERALAAIGRLSTDPDEAEIGSRQVIAALPPRGTLVSFAQYEHYAFGYEEGRSPYSVEPVRTYLAFVLAAGAAPVVVTLGPADRIDPLVRRVRQQVAEAATAPEQLLDRAELAYRKAAGELRAAVWDPVRPLLHGSEIVLVVPDGALNLVHLSALPIGESEYLVEHDPPVNYLSAERDLARRGGPSGTGLLALGNVSYEASEAIGSSALAQTFPSQPVHGESTLIREPATHVPRRGQRPDCEAFETLRFSPLPASAAELDRVVSLWVGGDGRDSERRLRGAEAPARVVRLDGPAANETSIKLLAPGKRVVHLATHGFFLGGVCRSALDSTAQSPSAGQSVGENPLLLSGLALAGANTRGLVEPGEDDGILTAEEIASLDLSGVEWVVLSACDTGTGEVRAGDGVLGLRRAFRIAGARTVIMSLWPVEDDASHFWMSRLYAHRFRQRLSSARAVRDATLDALRARRAAGESTHPFFWAGFLAAGDWN